MSGSSAGSVPENGLFATKTKQMRESSSLQSIFKSFRWQIFSANSGFIIVEEQPGAGVINLGDCLIICSSLGRGLWLPDPFPLYSDQ